MNKFRSISRIAGAIVLGTILLVTLTIPVGAGPALFQLALELDGTNDYATATDSNSLDLGGGATEDFTIETFFYVPDLTNVSIDTLFWKQDSYGMWIWFRNPEADRFVFKTALGPSNYAYFTGDLDLAVGWHHVALTYDNEWSATFDKRAIYVDGNLLASDATGEWTPGMLNSSWPLAVGGGPGLEFTQGWMEELRFSDTLRYTGSTYTVPTAPFANDSHTRALWHFDEAWGSGTTFADSSGNGNTLTSYGGAKISNPSGTPPVTISGNARVAGAVLHYTDGTPKTATSGSTGQYSITVPSGWSGTVTPTMSGCNFNPTSKTYTNVLTNKTAQNYAVDCRFTYQSVGSRDGWVLESGENSNIGGSLNSTYPYFNLGDDASKKQFRSIVSFNTSNLPDGAVLTQAKLTLTRKSITGGTNPFTLFQGLKIDQRKGFFSTAASLQTSDFEAATAPAGISLGPYNPTPSGAAYTITLPAAAYPYVNKLTTNGGLTQFRLRFKLDDNNNTVANYISFYSGNCATASYRPQLILTFHAP